MPVPNVGRDHKEGGPKPALRTERSHRDHKEGGASAPPVGPPGLAHARGVAAPRAVASGQ
jgi:hypothetical protein